MSNTPLTERAGKRVIHLVLIGMALQLFLIGYVFTQGYLDRWRLVNSQRVGCERGKLDRGANAGGWRIAEGARRADGQIDVADKYKEIAEGLEQRSRIDCEEAFPSPGILP